jgi:proteasome assembly chaperone (PAC2) family protein
MWEDGHMVSDDIYYLRTRNMNDETGMMIWNGNHQVYDAGEDYNKTGEIALRVDRWGNG